MEKLHRRSCNGEVASEKLHRRSCIGEVASGVGAESMAASKPHGVVGPLHPQHQSPCKWNQNHHLQILLDFLGLELMDSRVALEKLPLE